jgi:hypothetical protein
MSVSEFARLTHLSEEQVRRGLRRGDIVGYRPSGSARGAWRIDWTEATRLRTETRGTGNRPRRDRRVSA